MSRMYYQIDYIDKDDKALYISTFKSKQYKTAVKHLNILNKANECINADTKFILSSIEVYDYDDEIEIINENITKVKTVNEKLQERRKNLYAEN